MSDKGFARRFLAPLCTIVGIMAVSSLIYHGSSSLSPGLPRTIIKDVFGAVMFLSIWFFAFIGPPVAYLRGARFWERLVIAYANPLIWLVRMGLIVSCQFSAIEMVYFYLLPWTFGAVCVALFEFSIAELACRSIEQKKESGRYLPLHLPTMAMLLAGIAGTYVGLIRGQEWVYLVVRHYATHFLK